MPQRHSKNNTDTHHFTYHEKAEAKHGTLKQRLGTDSQTPFGYCSLCLHAVRDAVASPSGHLYCRECMLEYLLTKTKELKRQQVQFDAEQAKAAEQRKQQEEEERMKKLSEFEEKEDGVARIAKRKIAVSAEEKYSSDKRKKIDDRSDEEKKRELRAVAFWLPEYTPETATAAAKRPSKRPSSPMSGQPIRAKDLIPIDLVADEVKGSGPSRFICPISKKQITSQKVVLLKKSRQYMLESVAQDLAYPSMTCPITGGKFSMDDVLELRSAATGFAASGAVEAQVYRPTMM